MGQLIVLVALLVLLWLLLIRPARRRQVAQQELLAGIEVGDEILTAGGIYGYVRELHGDDEILVEVAPDIELRMARRAVAAIIPPDDDEDEDEEVDDEAVDEVALDGEIVDDHSASSPDANDSHRG